MNNFYTVKQNGSKFIVKTTGTKGFCHISALLLQGQNHEVDTVSC